MSLAPATRSQAQTSQSKTSQGGSAKAHTYDILCRLKLESEVKDNEEDWEIFDLKKTSLDNVFYLAYGA